MPADDNLPRGQQGSGEGVSGGEGAGQTGGGDIDGVEEVDSGEATHVRGTGNAGNEVEMGLEFDRDELQAYVLMCSQQAEGGLRDKPGK